MNVARGNLCFCTAGPEEFSAETWTPFYSPWIDFFRILSHTVRNSIPGKSRFSHHSFRESKKVLLRKPPLSRFIHHYFRKLLIDQWQAQFWAERDNMNRFSFFLYLECSVFKPLHRTHEWYLQAQCIDTCRRSNIRYDKIYMTRWWE